MLFAFGVIELVLLLLPDELRRNLSEEWS